MIGTVARRLAAGALATACLAAGPALATNGYIANGYGGASKGMAGAGVAVPSGVLGLAQNPAMGHMVGNEAGLCLTSFLPDRSVTVSPGGPLTPGTHESNNEFFLIPCGGANWVLSDRLSFGAFLFGNGGMNTEYDTNFFSGLGAGSSPLGVNLEQAFIGLNLSIKATERLSFGIAPIIAIQRFSATGLEAFAGMSIAPGNVTNRGEDWSTGVGVNLGVLWQPTSELTFGASYRSRIDMEAFDKYSGLFAEGGDFDIPAVATLGVAYTPASIQKLTLTAEWQRIFYGDIRSLANPNAPPNGPLGAPNGVGFGWKDMDVFRVAAIYRHDDRWTFRGGVSHASAFIDDDSAVMNTLAPATPQWHASLGASYRINDRWGVTGSWTHAFDNSVTGSNPALTGVAQPVKIRMSQNEFALGLTYRW
ncbi:OmpP1/FadL family transporter [Thetidibacter halocola]|uniref:Outer membrane protein transport protein n=1 Tax=Thetidibacter halocola TaxID=2827239 RepID=A0A8J7WAP3_9RHOB|nr:outer membrane protein transport protein [Thetidibacter halocola]MBS0123014.1 outer membrane protein transport protein [Thetidibacter halocola]